MTGNPGAGGRRPGRLRFIDPGGGSRRFDCGDRFIGREIGRKGSDKGTSVANLMGQLGGDDGVLLMYLAGELPDEDRAEVDRRLARDPALRAELESLREAHDSFAAALPALDRVERLPAPQGPGVRRVVRAMEQWQAGRLAAVVAPAPVKTLRYPWWAYPLAAAASVVIAFVVWWGNADRPQQFRRNQTAYEDRGYAPFDAAGNDVAIAWAMGGTTDEPDDSYRLIDPSDYAVLMQLIDDGGADGAPRQNGAVPGPGDIELDDDEFFLL